MELPGCLETSVTARMATMQLNKIQVTLSLLRVCGVSLCISCLVLISANCNAEPDTTSADVSKSTNTDVDEARQPSANQPTSITDSTESTQPPTAAQPETTDTPVSDETTDNQIVRADSSGINTLEDTTSDTIESVLVSDAMVADSDLTGSDTVGDITPNDAKSKILAPVAMPDHDAARRAIAGVPIESPTAARSLGVPSKSLSQFGQTHAASQPLVTSSSGKPSWISSYIPGGFGTLKSVGALAVVIGLIFLLKPIIRKLGGPMARVGGPSGVMEILAKYPFVKGQVFVLVKIDRRILLLCQTAQNSTTLCEYSDPDEVASLLRRLRDDEGDSFNHRLEQLLHGKNRSAHTASDAEHLSVTASKHSNDPFSMFRKKRPQQAETPDMQDAPRDVIDLTKAKRRWPRLAKRSSNDTQTIRTESHSPRSTSSLEIHA